MPDVTPTTPPPYTQIMKEKILNQGIDNESCGGPFKVFHQIWLTLALSNYCVLGKKMLKGP